jgi:YHS domain-containing protein
MLQNILYYLVWAGFFFLMMRYGCGAHIMGHGYHHGPHSDGQDAWTPPEQAIDPVCGMIVRTAQAKSAVHDGHVYYFCSTDCRNKFEADPASYAQKDRASVHHGEHHHAY